VLRYTHVLIRHQVNRLTRELSQLRAHSASVASTASSTSAGGRQRSSSNVSTGFAAPAPAAPPGNPRSSSTSITAPPALGIALPSTNSFTGNPSSIPTTPRYDDLALQRLELDAVKRENERLKQRVRELELLVRRRRASSVSTTASSVPAAGASSSSAAERLENS
jgi:hypothetical protein